MIIKLSQAAVNTTIIPLAAEPNHKAIQSIPKQPYSPPKLRLLPLSNNILNSPGSDSDSDAQLAHNS